MNYAPPKNNRRRLTRKFCVPRPYDVTSNGAYHTGDVIYNNAPTTDSVLKWICVTSSGTSGKPATWVEVK